MEFVEQWVNKFEAYEASLEPFTLEYAEQVTGFRRRTMCGDCGRDREGGWRRASCGRWA